MLQRQSHSKVNLLLVGEFTGRCRWKDVRQEYCGVKGTGAWWCSETGKIGLAADLAHQQSAVAAVAVDNTQLTETIKVL